MAIHVLQEHVVIMKVVLMSMNMNAWVQMLCIGVTELHVLILHLHAPHGPAVSRVHAPWRL